MLKPQLSVLNSVQRSFTWLYWHVNDRNISVLERSVWKPVDDVLLGRLSLLKWMWIKDGVFRRELSSFSEVTMNSRLNEILLECSRIIMSHDESSCVIMRHHKSSEVTMLTPRESRCSFVRSIWIKGSSKPFTIIDIVNLIMTHFKEVFTLSLKKESEWTFQRWPFTAILVMLLIFLLIGITVTYMNMSPKPNQAN